MSPRLAMPMPLSLTFREAFELYTSANRAALDEGIGDIVKEIRDFVVSTVNGVLSKVTFIDDLRQIHGVEDLIGKLSDESAALEGAAGKINEPRYGGHFRAPEMIGSGIGRIIGTIVNGVSKMITWPVDFISKWANENADIAFAMTLFAVVGGMNALMSAPGSMGRLAGMLTMIIPITTNLVQEVIRKLTNRLGIGYGGITVSKSKGTTQGVLSPSQGRVMDSFNRAVYGDQLDEGLLTSIKQMFLGLFTNTEALETLKQGVDTLGLNTDEPDIAQIQAKVVNVIKDLQAKGVDIDSEAFRWGMAGGRLFKGVVGWLPKRVLNFIFSVLPRGMKQRLVDDHDLAAFVILAMGLNQIGLLYQWGGSSAAGMATTASATIAYSAAAMMGAAVSAVHQLGKELLIGD